MQIAAFGAMRLTSYLEMIHRKRMDTIAMVAPISFRQKYYWPS